MADRYISGVQEDVAGAIAEELVKALESIGIINPNDCVIAEHAKIVESKDGLEYYWDDKLLMTTEKMLTTNGVRIIRNEVS